LVHGVNLDWHEGATLTGFSIAGATGQGKSVLLNNMIISLLYKKHPAELKFVLIDTHIIEFNLYSQIEKHYLTKLPDSEKAIVSETYKVVRTLQSLCKEMDDRYELISKSGTKNIREYNQRFKIRRLNPLQGHRFLPYIVVVIDEYSDLAMISGKETESSLIQLTGKGHIAGIHIILATQRPTKNIITGDLKANFPVQIAFKVSDSLESRIIIDKNGAEDLSGRGDALYCNEMNTTRIQVPYVSTEEIREIVCFIADQQGYSHAYELPEYISSSDNYSLGSIDLNERDPLFEEAARLIVVHQQGSTSLIQRKFVIGYNRAGRLMDQLEVAGVVGPTQGSKPRDVLIIDEYSLEQKISSLNKGN
ncbi:FtsK/SpoIIIE domain-containing protein, partial [Dysgonomonas termitidis]